MNIIWNFVCALDFKFSPKEGRNAIWEKTSNRRHDINFWLNFSIFTNKSRKMKVNWNFRRFSVYLFVSFIFTLKETKTFFYLQATKGGKIEKSRKTKDPNAPKKAGTSYMLWLSEVRPTIAKPGMGVAEVAKKAGEIWRSMEDKSVRKIFLKKLLCAFFPHCVISFCAWCAYTLQQNFFIANIFDIFVLEMGQVSRNRKATLSTRNGRIQKVRRSSGF